MTEYDSCISEQSLYPRGKGFSKSVVTQPGAETDPEQLAQLDREGEAYVVQTRRDCLRGLVGVCRVVLDRQVFCEGIPGAAKINTFRAVCAPGCPNDTLPKVLDSVVEII